MTTVELFFDFVSPYSYLAHSQLGSLGVPVQLKPIGVLELMKQVNNTPTSVTCPVKRAYAGRDLMRWAGRYGVPFAPPNFGALDGALLLRLATAAQAQNLIEPVTATIFPAVWGGQGDATPAGVGALLEAAGLPGQALLEAAASQAVADALAATTAQAAEAGVFGAPTFRVDGELYFGNDRLDFVREALAAKRAA